MASIALSPEQLAALAKDNKQATAYAIVITFTILSFIIVCLRIYTRFFLLRKPGFEDYFILASSANALIMGTFMVREIRYGLGRHAMFLTMNEAKGVLWCVFGSIISYNFSLTLTKMSILLQYRRLFIAEESCRVIYVAMVIVVAYGVECFFTGLLACIPVHAFWDFELQATAKCLPKFPLWYANATLNIASDLMIATIPIPTLRKLNIPKRKKIALMITLGIGWFACIVGFLRVHALVDMQRNFADFSWHTQETTYWSCVETNVGIICACLPALSPLLARLGISGGGPMRPKDEAEHSGLLPRWLRAQRTADIKAKTRQTAAGVQQGLQSIVTIGRWRTRKKQHGAGTTLYGPLSTIAPEVLAENDGRVAELELTPVQSADDNLEAKSSTKSSSTSCTTLEKIETDCL